MKKLTNSFSSGGGGYSFETHVQAAFVTLMITGGYTPCFPSRPIIEVKLQCKIDGYETDDLIVITEDPVSKEKRKLLGQIKHAISITKSDPLLPEVLKAAWIDFKNTKTFTQDRDAIALITGPLSATDQHNVSWLLEKSRNVNNAEEFYRHVRQAKFSPTQATKKLEVIKCHLDAANGGIPLSDKEVYIFLRHFHILGYDLDIEYSVVKSLLHSHISQYQQDPPSFIWSRILELVQQKNKHAAVITKENLPEDLAEMFRRKNVVEFPRSLVPEMAQPIENWVNYPAASYLALILLIGAWSEDSDDVQEVSNLLEVDYKSWLQKAKEIIQPSGSPLSIKDGAWKISRRTELLGLLGPRILDKDLDAFKSIVVKVLKEHDPALQLPTDKRHAANIYGKKLIYSQSLRKGLAEGLALIGSNPDEFINASHGKPEAISSLAIRDLLTNVDWVTWGSLNNLLPILAEASPNEFLKAVDAALQIDPCPFDELFAQEENDIIGQNYLTGLLWALEGLAWDPELLVKVCVLLAELANRDSGGRSGNRPSNSLATILLPWLPQTLGIVEKRESAVRTVLKAQPKIGWNLLLQLLPGHHQVSSGTYKLKWRKMIPEDWKKGVSKKEYWDQISVYSEWSVEIAGTDPSKLTQLILQLDHLVLPSFEKLLERLKASDILQLPESNRREIWEALIRFANKHRRFPEAKWSLPAELIDRVEEAAKALEPINPVELYQHLFGNRDYDLYDQNNSWDEVQKKINKKRDFAVAQILAKCGLQSVIKFAETVKASWQVGNALGASSDFECELLPNLLDEESTKIKEFIGAFIWRRFDIEGWEWCDRMVTTSWTLNQKARFLCALPFEKETWNRAATWLGSELELYWSSAIVNSYRAREDLNVAVEKFLQFNRPNQAIDCLYVLLREKQSVSVKSVVSALLQTASTQEQASGLNTYYAEELIKFLQSEPTTSPDDLFNVEWKYLALLGRYGHGKPIYLTGKLASDPEFFCELIRIIYHSKKEDAQVTERSEDAVAIAKQAWKLLDDWKTPPGTQIGGSFSSTLFQEWLSRVIAICTGSGHLEVALIHIGEVLIHAPPIVMVFGLIVLLLRF